jgi:enoyl-CoA hydratase/carnithine racemase
MTEFENDSEIRVVVLSGAGGKAFISGADISEFEEKRSSQENILEYNRIAGRANAAIIDFPKPTIAMIQGYCIGGGLGVALCCDLSWSRLSEQNPGLDKWSLCRG